MARSIELDSRCRERSVGGLACETSSTLGWPSFVEPPQRCGRNLDRSRDDGHTVGAAGRIPDWFSDSFLDCRNSRRVRFFQPRAWTSTLSYSLGLPGDSTGGFVGTRPWESVRWLAHRFFVVSFNLFKNLLCSSVLLCRRVALVYAAVLVRCHFGRTDVFLLRDPRVVSSTQPPSKSLGWSSSLLLAPRRSAAGAATTYPVHGSLPRVGKSDVNRKTQSKCDRQRFLFDPICPGRCGLDSPANSIQNTNRHGRVEIWGWDSWI